ncbi:MAG: 1-acyl-sn-glycerol-3-phosphate acyltransferase [Beijerinckiaceae bacterium]|nr:1-acyl-sn-glycerol-3-phosphate acyltransferase [Beijerinckiaceae bacterium]
MALPGIALQSLFLRFDRPLKATFPVVFHRYVARVLRLRRVVRGVPATERPLMLVANHVSWLDIIALSGVMPVSFIAKSEVASWGVFGLFARLQRSIFVDRDRRSGTGAVNATIATRLKDGDVMVLFAEGTTGDGVRILPFRSALIGAARDAATREAGPDGLASVYLQPVSIAYTHLSGLPAGRFERPHTAWYGDMTLPPHLKAIVTGDPLDVTISFGEPQRFDAGTDRKLLTRQLEEMVRDMTMMAHNGRLPDRSPQQNIALPH